MGKKGRRAPLTPKSMTKHKIQDSPRRLIFLDETWTKTNMTRPRGRSPRGQRLIGQVPWGHWKTTTFLAGLRHDRIVAPLVLDGPINGIAFRAYIEQVFAKLKALLRKTKPRSREALWRSIGSIVSDYTPNECANYFQNCGYALRGKLL